MFAWLHRFRRSKAATKVAALGVLKYIVVIAVFFFPPIKQDLLYHVFADARPWLGIANGGNVLSNLPFLLVGLIGTGWLATNWQQRKLFVHPAERWLWLCLFLALASVSAGSAYYHLAPDNHSLIWDRLPMSVGFMTLFGIIITERVHIRLGLRLTPLLIAAGIGSVLYWSYTDDLRAYALVQFLPILFIPLILMLFPGNAYKTSYIIFALAWYIGAKLCEHYDTEIFALTAHLVSGHTIKHLLAAVSCYQFYRYLAHRKNVQSLLQQSLNEN